MRRGARLWIAVLLASAAQAEPESPRVLLRLRSEGPHAILDCAERAHREGRALAELAADGSDSLDRLQEDLGVRGVRALFRRPDARPLELQRRSMRARFERRLAVVAHAARAAVSAEPPPDLAHIYSLELPPDADSRRAAARLRSDPHVEWAQENFRIEADFVPDDPFFSRSDSWGQGYRDLWGLDRIGAPAAWDRSQGESIVVAVIDTGVDDAHPDIAANLWVNPGEDLNGNGRVDPSDWNGLDDDGNGYADDLRGFDFYNSVDAGDDGDYTDPLDVGDPDPFDDNGHGTHVAGTIAAVGNNGIGIVGVAPRARIMALKGLSAAGNGSIDVLARAIVYAADHGARVINNSWSCSRRCPRNPVAEEAVAYAHALGAIVVTSAGNRRDDVVFFSPENLRETLVVAASDENDAPAGFSNGGFLVDVAAPGAGSQSGSAYLPWRAILSLRSSGAQPAADGEGLFVVDDAYLRWSGTSMSAPHVAGVVALLLAEDPGRSFEDVRAAIRQGARDLGPPGHDRSTGAGGLDAARALERTPLRLQAGFASPRQGVVVSQREGSLDIEGRVLGRDLLAWSLEVGEGRDPSSWKTLVAEERRVVEAGRLFEWRIADLEDGPRVLRLVARSTDGRVIEEFLLVDLERNPPFRVSSQGQPAFAPSLSGQRVVWQSPRNEAGDLDLFVSDLLRGTEGPLARGPGDQRNARLDGQHAIWEEDRGDGSIALHGCRFSADPRSCRPELLVGGDARRGPPALSGGRIVWAEDEDGWRLRGCRLRRAGGCVPRPIAEHPAWQLYPSIDGRRLVWSDGRDRRFQLFHCVLDPGGCVPAALDPPRHAVATLVSDDVVVWTELALPLRVLACRLDPRTGSCPPVLVRAADEIAPALSGNRIVWHERGRDGDRDVFFCEFDAEARTCPVQRLTGSAAEQSNPEVDGALVVWEDDRNGPSEIFGLELPSLSRLRDRRVRSGQALRVFVASHGAGGAPPALHGEVAGTTLQDLGAVFHDRGDGRGVFEWTPRAEHVGVHLVTFTATSEGRLFSRRSLRLTVREPLASVRRHWFGRLAAALERLRR